MLPLLLLAVPWADAPEFPPAKQQAALAATVRLQLGTNTTAGQGTAVVVHVNGKRATLLTAEHNLVNVNAIKAEFFTPERYPEPAAVVTKVSIAFRMANEDLAVLQLDIDQPVGIAPLPPRHEAMKLKFPALSLGCDDGVAPLCRAERVLGVKLVKKPDGSEALYWECERASVLGRSGGPLLDTRGRLIGICSGAQGGRGYYTHIHEIHAALDHAGFRYLTPDKK